ncbi:VOC family protein [Salinigranum marinum]|uniref:VOC family protein n=1 Tax=Salinigranum marinum TaxID=1515595 RepID=UPI002989D978|nr:VOC family protein [Salinigranum marinum]
MTRDSDAEVGGETDIDATTTATAAGLSVVDLDHVALRVVDLDRALGFYHDLLGLPIRDRARYDRGEVPYVAVVAGGRHLHLVPDETFDGDVGGEHVCLLLRSDEIDSRGELEALLDDLADAGVTVEADEPKKRYGAYGRAWAAYVRDPDGRRVELKVH